MMPLSELVPCRVEVLLGREEWFREWFAMTMGRWDSRDRFLAELLSAVVARFGTLDGVRIRPTFDGYTHVSVDGVVMVSIRHEGFEA